MPICVRVKEHWKVKGEYNGPKCHSCFKNYFVSKLTLHLTEPTSKPLGIGLDP